MVIFNERKWIEDIIKNRDWMKMGHPRKMIKFLIKYYYPDFKDKKPREFQRFILDEMNAFNYPIERYEEYEYAGYALSTCKKALKGELNTYLRTDDCIGITQGELDIISKAKNNQQKKLLFTLYVLAKLYPYHSGWINYKDSEIFKLANVHLSVQDRDYLINDLYQQGLLQLNHIIGKNGLKVDLVENTPVVMQITLEKAFGNQYLAYIKGDEWSVCSDCGRLFKRSSQQGRPPIYCPKCAYKVKLEQNKSYKS